MKIKITLLLLVITCSGFGQHSRVSANEFQQIVGKWNGKLVYLDYQSNQPYEMPADLEIVKINGSQFKFIQSYPNEPSANSIDTIAIGANGKMIDKELVKSKEQLSNGNLKIITEIQGHDGNDNQPALIRHTYLIGKKTFEIRKAVQFSGSTNWILRHTYSYSKN